MFAFVAAVLTGGADCTDTDSEEGKFVIGGFSCGSSHGLENFRHDGRARSMAVVEDVPGAVKAARSHGSGRRAAEVDQAVDLVAAYCFGEVVAGVGGVAVEAGVLVGTGLGAVVVGPTGGVDDACDPPGSTRLSCAAVSAGSWSTGCRCWI